MRFQANADGVIIADGANEFNCSLADFILMEPAYFLPKGATEVLTPEVHCYLLAGNQLPANSEAATYPAKIADYVAALAELHPEPEPAPEIPTPNWQDFRLELMVCESFRDWAATLPADWREDLKACAILCNVEALQTTYNHLASIYPPGQAAAAEWQQIADANHIPTTF